MLPIGCVHLRNMPNLNKLCRKLNIDCTAAVVGFDAHAGFSHAVLDGWIICEEFKETVTVAYEAYELEEAKKQIQKRKDKVLANWTRLVKVALIRERLKLKYETKTSVFNKMDKNGKGLSKCLNDEGKTSIQTELQASALVNYDLVGGKLNKITKDAEACQVTSSNNIDELPCTSTARETAFLKVKSNTKAPPKTKTTKIAPAEKKLVKPNSDSDDPEFDFKEMIRNKKQKNPPRNAKKKAIVESEDEETAEKSVDSPAPFTKPLAPKSEDDVNLSESDEG